GVLQDSELVARPLGRLAMANCASPAYLAAHGTPRTLADLDRHRLIHYSTTLGGKPLGFEYRDGSRVRFKAMQGVITVNGIEAYQAACIAGLGLIQAPRWGLAPLIGEGLLVEVLPEWPAEPMAVTLLYAHRRHVPKRLQVWMDWIAGQLAPHLM